MEAMKKGSLKSSLFLLLAAFIWGVAFVAQSVGMDYMGPFSFNGPDLSLAPWYCYRL